MAEITAALVKELREKSGAGMMDCKKALAETNGDLEAAVDWLRAKGIASAAKKSTRVAAEGLVGIAVSDDGSQAAMVEVNSQTDFVARNQTFQGFVRAVSHLALAGADEAEALLGTAMEGGRTVRDELTEMVATIGENMTLRRVARLAVSPGVVAGYVHNPVADGMGKIGALVALRSDGDPAQLGELARKIAMHVVAAAPLSLGIDDLNPEVLERERQVQIEKARESGQSDEIIAKMIEGRLRKYYEEVVLHEQVFVMAADGKSKVKQEVANLAKTLGSAVELAGFVRFQLGEGIEKEVDDFAAEVRSLAG